MGFIPQWRRRLSWINVLSGERSEEKRLFSAASAFKGCLYDTGATFAPERVHSGSLSWLYICLHDTTTKCHAGASHPSVSSPRFLYRGENFTAVRNPATVSCKRETTTSFGVKSVCFGLERVAHA